MKRSAAVLSPPIEWGVSGRALAGEVDSGDAHLVKNLPCGALLAVVDGLGHGEEAARVARIAVNALAEGELECPIELLRLCHQALRSSRGAVVSLAFVNAEQDIVTWLGVGNVEGVLLRANAQLNPARENILLRGGVVGLQLPPLHATTNVIGHGDLLILATDGIRSAFAESVALEAPPQQISAEILARYGKSTDDALVLVARYLGRAK
jgi:serine/threonine protein phosphatase PrpC